MPDQQEIYKRILVEKIGSETELKYASKIAAGNHNQGIRVETNKGVFFLKLNFDHEKDVLQREAEGLEALRKSTFLKIPQIHGYGRIGDYNFLLTEFIQADRNSADYWENLGLGLAHLHLTHQEKFGLNNNNYIASIPQKNCPTQNWTEFFIEQRLDPLLGKAYFDKLITLGFFKKFQEIYPKLESIFPSEKPSLLHGDLWSGNILTTSNGQPCLIDPAIYFGHREMDIAFSRLFGGFDSRFYQAYESILPLEPGFDNRISIYNLYPLLVHLILFGTAYLPGIERTITKFIR
ncbi:fructosamine kinase family protein [uncultured Algoriphagus sp.]|mgnify:FL=1|uniref:fructosamine kinase family protein n=1 Tax=uncultured Algoriphagus sp. TaxID=417365 RepID=UPI0030EE950A|tara:strand:+ start:17885 stop:18760 length:876 start_codon:yes stop_codon:yes gene_type:complete